MFVSKKFYDQCSPSYKKVLAELEQKLSDINSKEWDVESIARERRSAIWKFSRNYLTPIEFWRCYMIDKDYDDLMDPMDDYEYWEREYKTVCYALFHLHYVEKWIDTRYDFVESHLQADDNKYIKLMNFWENLNEREYDFTWYQILQRDLGYPHNRLKEIFRYFELKTSHLPPKKFVDRYENMNALYPKIKAAFEDVEKWFKLLVEVNDNQFLKNNVEARLGKNYLNIRLWKLYLSYLKEHGEYICLLKTYSKYCRFFLDDFGMLEDYKQATAEYGPIKLEWYNLFEFEIKKDAKEDTEGKGKGDDDNMPNDDERSNENSVIKMEEIVPTFDRTLCTTFFDTNQKQSFSLRGPLITYILTNANHRILRKLYNSCKYFYARKLVPICYTLQTRYFETKSRNTKFNDENLFLESNENPSLFIKNMYISGCISMRIYDTYFPSSFMSALIPHLFRCDAKYIRLCNQRLTFNELKFLIQSGDVAELCTFSCVIIDEEVDEFIQLEKIMQFLPNLEKLRLSGVNVNENTAHVLAKQKFNEKVNNIFIENIHGQPFDPNEFLKYCITNKDECLELKMKFSRTFNDDFIKEIQQIFENYENSQKIDAIKYFITYF